MKFIFTVAIMVVLLTTKDYGQHLTPLYQFLATNTPVGLAPELRNFRSELSQELQNATPGLKIDRLFEKMTALHERLNSVLAEIRVTYNSAGQNLIIVVPDTDQIVFPYKPRGQVKTLTELSQDITHQIFPPLNEIVRKCLRSLDRGESRQGLRYAMIQAARNFGVEIPAVSGTDDTTELSEQIVKIVDAGLKNLITQEVQRIDKWFALNAAGSTDKLKGDTLALALNGAIDKLREVVAQVLDRAENTINSVADRFSRLLVAGNFGLAFATGTGTVSGGVLLSWTPPPFSDSPCESDFWNFWRTAPKAFQFGLFTNFTAGAIDATEPGFGILGGMTRATIGDAQGEFSIGAYFGNDRSFKDFKSFDVGGGLTFNVVHKVLVGLAGFKTRFTNRRDLDTWSFTVSLSPTGGNAPTLFIGAVREGSKRIKPLLNFAYPLGPSL